MRFSLISRYSASEIASASKADVAQRERARIVLLDAGRQQCNEDNQEYVLHEALIRFTDLDA